MFWLRLQQCIVKSKRSHAGSPMWRLEEIWKHSVVSVSSSWHYKVAVKFVYRNTFLWWSTIVRETLSMMELTVKKLRWKLKDWWNIGSEDAVQRITTSLEQDGLNLCCKGCFKLAKLLNTCHYTSAGRSPAEAQNYWALRIVLQIHSQNTFAIHVRIRIICTMIRPLDDKFRMPFVKRVRGRADMLQP